MASALSDALANPSVRGFGSYPHVFNGSTWDRLRGANVFKDVNGVTITTIATLWTPAGGKKIRLLGGLLSVSAACSILFEDNAAASSIKFRTPKLLVDTPFQLVLPPNGLLLSAVDNVLKGTSSAAAVLTGTLFGCEE